VQIHNPIVSSVPPALSVFSSFRCGPPLRGLPLRGLPLKQIALFLFLQLLVTKRDLIHIDILGPERKFHHLDEVQKGGPIGHTSRVVQNLHYLSLLVAATVLVQVAHAVAAHGSRATTGMVEAVRCPGAPVLVRKLYCVKVSSLYRPVDGTGAPLDAVFKSDLDALQSARTRTPASLRSFSGAPF
jgi:hypothetical protein